MSLIVDNMQWIMIGSGLFTLTMLHALFAPRGAAHAMFGESIDTASGVLVMRSWGALIASGGAMLVYGGFHPEVRPLVLLYVGAGKLIFVALVLLRGPRFLKHQAGIAVAVDSLMVVLFALYLYATRV